MRELLSFSASRPSGGEGDDEDRRRLPLLPAVELLLEPVASFLVAEQEAVVDPLV